MTPRDDLDGLATSRRADRPKNQRARLASRVVARAAWLDAPLVFWTGERAVVLRLPDAALPVRTLLQDRVADLPSGLYAVSLGFAAPRPSGDRRRHRLARGRAPLAPGGPLGLEVTAVRAVTRDLVADTARAIEAAARFPRAAARLVGPVEPWRRTALARLDTHRRAATGAVAWRAGAPDGLALEARALWLGAGRPPSATLPEPALVSWTSPRGDREPLAARLAAVALGRRHAWTACHPSLAAWAAAGRALDRWPAAAVLWAATVAGAEVLLSVATSWPVLNDALGAVWADERRLDVSPVSADEIVGLARLLSALAAARAEPERRETRFAQPAVQRLGVAWSRDRAPGTPRGGALDPAGGAAVVAVADRLRRKGAAHASETMAGWIESCRPVMPPETFWRDALSILPSGRGHLDAERASRLVENISCHGEALAGRLARAEDGSTERLLIPAVLTRGPDSVRQVLRRDLWLPDEGAIDAALTWVETAERARPVAAPDAAIPMPRDAFTVTDSDLRLALVRLGLRVWDKSGAEARDVEELLDLLARSVSSSNAAHWRTALPRLGDVAVSLARRVLRAPGPAGTSPVTGASWLVAVMLDACARWEAAGFADTARLARILAGRWPSAARADDEWSPEDDDRNELVVRLSEGRIPRLLALLRHPPAPRRPEWRAVDGWALAASHPLAHAWLSACLDRPELVARIVRLLERLALVARLEPGATAARLLQPIDLTAEATPAWPDWVPPDGVETLGQIARARAVADASQPLPGGLRRLLDGPAIAEAELAALRARAGDPTMTSSERARLDKLERLAADPAALTAGLCAELRKALPKQLALSGLAALETLVRHDLDRHWRQVLGGDAPSVDSPAWDNALYMLGTVKYNRRALRRLLRHAARGDRCWMRDLEPNRTFLAGVAAAGCDPDAWLAERSLVVAGPFGPLRASATTDPLEVLQMGSLFGTCLSAGKFNAHAAVAAAVEANKRVLYVKDAAERVFGRRLLALTRDGEVIGFASYGAGPDEPGRHGAWVKLALELLVLEIVRASGARFMPAARFSEGLDEAEERSLVLFCRGYVDAPEPFDWWIEALAAADPRSGGDDRPRLRALLARPVPPDLDARGCPEWRREDLGWAACRALLWLGAEAPSLSGDQAEALGLGAAHRALAGLSTPTGAATGARRSDA